MKLRGLIFGAAHNLGATLVGAPRSFRLRCVGLLGGLITCSIAQAVLIDPAAGVATGVITYTVCGTGDVVVTVQNAPAAC